MSDISDFQKTDLNSSIIAIDIGATNIRAAVVEFTGITAEAEIESPKCEIIKYASCKTPKTESQEEFVASIVGLLHDNLSEEEINLASAIGISSIGPIDMNAGSILNSPNIGCPRVDLKNSLEAEFKKPVFVLKDCNCGVLGEVIKNPELVDKCVLYITISTGLGGGLCNRGELLLGRDGNACEIGHIYVDSEYSVKCGCGCIGHWEGYSSGTGLPKFFRNYCKKNHIPMKCSAVLPESAELLNSIKSALSRDEIRQIQDDDLSKRESCESCGSCVSCETLIDPIGEKVDEYLVSDVIFLRFYDLFSQINAHAISSVIVAYSPDVIILDGSVALYNYDLLVSGIMKYIDEYLEKPKFCLSRLEGRATIYGAAEYARRKLKEAN